MKAFIPDFTNTRILVTGGAGFIGSAVLRYLHAQTRATLLNLDKLTYAGDLRSIASIEQSDRYQFEQLDITDFTALQRIVADFRPDAVLHLAAESHVDRSIESPGHFVQSNVVGTYSLLEAVRHYLNGLNETQASHFRFIHVSTDEVFGSLTASEPAFHPESPYQPRSPYSATKAASDHLAKAWLHTYGLPVIVTNCSNNYGPYQFPEKLIPMVILKCLQNETIPVYGQGANVRDWLYVEDHAAGLWSALSRGRVGETYTLGGHSERSNLDLVRQLCDLMDECHPNPDGTRHSSRIAFVQDRPGHDHRYAIDTAKAQRELAWSPKTRLADGLRQTVQWYLDNPSWWQSILDGSYQLQRLGKGASS